MFTLSGHKVLHEPEARHQCQLTVEIQMVKEFVGKVRQLPACSKSVRTFHGLFKNPCKMKGWSHTHTHTHTLSLTHTHRGAIAQSGHEVLHITS